MQASRAVHVLFEERGFIGNAYSEPGCGSRDSDSWDVTIIFGEPCQTPSDHLDRRAQTTEKGSLHETTLLVGQGNSCVGEGRIHTVDATLVHSFCRLISTQDATIATGEKDNGNLAANPSRQRSIWLT